MGESLRERIHELIRSLDLDGPGPGESQDDFASAQEARASKTLKECLAELERMAKESERADENFASYERVKALYSTSVNKLAAAEARLRVAREALEKMEQERHKRALRRILLELRSRRAIPPPPADGKPGAK